VDNGLAPEYGRTSGAVVNVVLKSGTNQVHGDTYEFNRNSYFNATNPFARRDASGRPFLQPAINYNDFGGTLGGPVYFPHLYNGKNRTFFFASWDISMLHENKPTILTVPQPNETAGNFLGDPRFDAVCDPVNAPTRWQLSTCPATPLPIISIHCSKDQVVAPVPATTTSGR
jgi:hypothetical protein